MVVSLKASALLAPLGLCMLLLACSMSTGQAADYSVSFRRSTPGNDFSCGQKDEKGSIIPFCKICAGIDQVADACDDNPECKSFDMEGDYCGYLKSAGAGSQAYTEGFTNFCKIGGDTCEGSYLVKFRASIDGNDIDCNYRDYEGKRQPFCYVSGYPVELAAACDANPTCQAFDTQGSSSGYLKSADGPTSYTEGSTTYIKA